MSKQHYYEINFRPDSLNLIEQMNEIVDEYIEASYRLTVRQLYYQLVARGIVENTERSYKRITSIVNDAKIAGLMDWEAIEDRTREFIRSTRWESGSAIVRAAADSFHMDRWINQKFRVFVIVEKEALAGVLEPVCRRFDVPLLAARGYPSGTVLREFAESDLLPCIGDPENESERQCPVILHLGDHDPSGIDMSRDLAERFYLFMTGTKDKALPSAMFRRIALNMKQIQEQKPPPNPAKSSDARFESYRAKFGSKSWELDALKPDYLSKLVEKHIRESMDPHLWDERSAEIEEIRSRISEVADQFDESEQGRES